MHKAWYYENSLFSDFLVSKVVDLSMPPLFFQFIKRSWKEEMLAEDNDFDIEGPHLTENYKSFSCSSGGNKVKR